MTDGFKIGIPDPTAMKRIRTSKLLSFIFGVTEDTGERSPRHIATYKTLRFEYYDNEQHQHLYIRGNITQYSTGLSNVQNFHFREALQGFIKLANEFDIDLQDMKIIKLEWGFNFTLPINIPVSRFVDNLLVYKGKMPTLDKVYRGQGSMKLFELAQQTFKIYNKTAQHKLHENVVRYEIVIESGTLLRKKGIYSIADLTKRTAVKALNEMLLYPTRHFMFYDHDIPFDTIPDRNKNMIMEYSHAKAWKKLMQNKPEGYRKKKGRFSAQITELSGIGWNQLFYDKVKEQITLLTE